MASSSPSSHTDSCQGDESGANVDGTPQQTNISETDVDVPGPSLANTAKQKTHMASVKSGSVNFQLELPDNVDESELENEEFLQGGNEDVKIWLNARNATHRTRRCSLLMCGLWVFCIVLLVILATLVGTIEVSPSVRRLGKHY